MKFLRLAFLILLAGCSTGNPVFESHDLPVLESEELRQADVEISGLNVSIQIFDAGVSPESSIYVAAAQVREVERRYLPYVLKQTLDRSGFWGAVRVLPKLDPSAEINVTATIIESSGTELSLHVGVTTATGKVWLDGIYRDVTDHNDYGADPDYVNDTFQDIYSRIANDMSLQLLMQSGGERQEIIDAALMRYGLALSPDVFSRYIEMSGADYVVTALPAHDDPMLLNLLRIRDSEYLFADSVDAHYEKLYRTVGPTYSWWRFYSFELVSGNERLVDIDATRGASKGSWYAMERTYKTFKEAKMNQDALRELSESFERETAATTTEVSGSVVELAGSLVQQYDTWRRILQAMYGAATEMKKP